MQGVPGWEAVVAVPNRRVPAPTEGVYGISVAADLVGMTPQTLRLYEDRGLLQPERTAGGTRRYSQDDLNRLHRIGQLLGDGLNLAGVAAVLPLERDNARLHAANRKIRKAVRDAGRGEADSPQ